MKLKNIYPICVSINENQPEKAGANVKKYAFVEVRLDAGVYSKQDLKSVIKASKSCIITCRPKLEYYSEAARQDLLLQAIKYKADFVDIEIESDPDFKIKALKLAKKHKVKIIISLHDFEKTPDLKALDKQIKAAKKTGADIVKIATLIRNKNDLKVLLAILAKYENLVVIGMGEKGQSLRLAGPFLGSLFTFAAPKEGKQTAPGQLIYSDLKKAYLQLGLIGK